MLVTIHQPDFMPWLGFFERWRRSDLLILLDDVQFLRRGWHHRDRIKTANGIAWLTVPTLKKGRFRQLISEVEIDNSQHWQRKHLGLVKCSYGRAPHFKSVFKDLAGIYHHGFNTLLDNNRALLNWIAHRLTIRTPAKLASTYRVKEVKSDRIIALCRHVGADHYLTGNGAKAYLDETKFASAGIEVIWDDFDHPVYPQMHGPFQPNLSVLDYLMMGGGCDG